MIDAAQTSSGTTMMSNSFKSNSVAKFNGLIKQSWRKRLSSSLANLFSYIYAVAPSFGPLYTIISFFRIMQFVGPSLCAPYSEFWSKEDKSYQTVGYISILFHLIPPDFRELISMYYLLVYSIIMILVIGLMAGSAYFFQKSASLPTFIPIFISFYVSSFGYCLYPIGFEFTFGQISRCIFKPETVNLSFSLAMIILAFLASVGYFWIFLQIISRTLFFQHDSLMTATTYPKNLIFLSTIIVNGLTGFAAQAEFLQPYLLFLTAIVYLVSIYILNLRGGLIHNRSAVAYFASCVTGFLASLIVGVMVLIKKRGSLLFLIIFGMIWVFAFVIGLLLLNRIYISYILILDKVAENNDNFDMVKNPNHFASIAIAGMKIAHPICIDWSFFRLAASKWQDSSVVWFIFCKFVAIYPEETQILAWIFHSVVALKIHGTNGRTIKEQSNQIARQRESNLSNDLKIKLNISNKHISSTKHKLRHVWDLAIQGNINEMEGATKRVVHEISKNDAEYLHIFQQYPNNRFVTRSYARFCKEVKADHSTFVDMLEKTRLLQRGLIVNEDQAHRLGMDTFPDLPNRVKNMRDSGTFNATESIAGSASENLESEDEIQADWDQTAIILNRINNVKIPAVRKSICVNLILYFVLFAVPVIVMLVYIESFINGIISPLNFLFSFGYLRTFVQQITAFGMVYVYETIGAIDPPPNTSRRNPTYFGQSWKTVDQLASILRDASVIVQQIGNFYKYSNNHPLIEEAKEIIFASSINYSFFESPTVIRSQMMTVQASISEMITQMSAIVKDSSLITDAVINNGVTLNMLNAMLPVGSKLDGILTLITNYVFEDNKSFNKISTYIMIGVIIFIVIVFFAMLYVQIKWLDEAKTETYKCLTSLPKNAVSGLAENLRVLKKENDESSTCNNTEMNKQEDNILKIFMNGGNDSTSSYIDRFILSAITLIVIILHIVTTILILNLMQYISNNNAQSSPHLNYLQGSYSLLLGSIQMLQLLCQYDVPLYRCPLFDETYLKDTYYSRIDKSREYYHMARYGGPSKEEMPYVGFGQALIRSSEMVGCEDKHAIPHDFLSAVKCYNSDNAVILIETVGRSRMIPYERKNVPLDPIDGIYNILWGLMIYPIWDTFFAPMISEIVPTIEENLSKKQSSVYPSVIAIFVISFLINLIAVYHIKTIDAHIRSVLRLLLHAPADVVMQVPKIVHILSSDFSKHTGDTTTRDAEFYEGVVRDLPDAIIIATCQEMTIESVNKSSSRIYNFGDTDVVGMKMSEFFSSDKFIYKNMEEIYTSTAEKTFENVIFKKSHESEMNLSITTVMINQKYVITTRDITQQVRYNTLIYEEKIKSDQLLASILPASLVPRVQAGELNISFAVQSATITFIDIVSFTPWCGSLPADKVMMTLNLLFKKFDSFVAQYITMTKIKCIGDCYMATGGIFETVNQPATHAKEVVCFGLDALDSVKELNEELSEKLQIRVGINTGGPIVAGVLGTEKPTFEIFGPAINMAQQMEHHGVPNNVHITRSVYELIYGDTFDIKERGSVEVKGGSVITYLVKRK